MSRRPITPPETKRSFLKIGQAPKGVNQPLIFRGRKCLFWGGSGEEVPHIDMVFDCWTFIFV